MKTITFYSYKGGVGRSLALSQVAIRLSEYGKKVCVLDFDLEAPGLHFKFHNYDKVTPISKGIVDYIDEFVVSRKIPASIKDFSIQLKPKNRTYKNIDLTPAGNIEKDDYWMKLSQIDWSSLFYKKESSGVKFFLDLKARINKELKPDFLLIDSRTGITDIAGITLRLLADEAVVLAANNDENMFGSKKIIKSLIDSDKTLFGAVPKVHFVLTRIPFTDEPLERLKETDLRNRRKKELLDYLKADTLDISVIHSDRRLEEDERHLMGYEYEKKTVSISNDYLKLFEKLSSDGLTDDEKREFRNKRLGVDEYQKAIAIRNRSKQIQHLDKAIEYDSSQSIFYFQRARALAELGNPEKAIQDYERSLNLTPNDPDTLNNLALLSEDTERAEKLFLEAIGQDEHHSNAYFNLAELYERQSKPKEALKFFTKAIDTESEPKQMGTLFNSRANLLRRKGEFESAIHDVYKAIEYDSSEATYFGTLAEIYFDKGMVEEFYMNLNVALAKGIRASQMSSSTDVYQKLVTDSRFLDLMNKYNLNVDEIIESS
ncbi:MAG: tetratricopeptide repeat protein [Flavobacteriales bacterium]|nr:tetratricopeptide repeat protein [Flavobacteriales bacterium]